MKRKIEKEGGKKILNFSIKASPLRVYSMAEPVLMRETLEGMTLIKAIC